MEVKIKKLHKDAIIPNYAHSSDAGLDITATSKFHDENGNICYGSGLAMSIPSGFVGLLFPRSSISKKDLCLANSVGVIDSGYIGEVIFKFKENYRHIYNGNDEIIMQDINSYDVGERIGQIIIMPYPKINFVEVDELDSSDRGDSGFGSSGA
ncbi:MAG: Deoxyuridine 5'-triphosphate nucleotidohydrolase [Acinetobacter bereziniae]|uniref:dUTP diphosphatase n=1 Tax=Acinetobacter bereziniae TaxID=106648 RepID=A0A833PHB9_ACIBZ|nr:MAG: Deoxyuridine 5'-triphosphate nucleotidohydrolase [Acinetobacter bereziniae]